MVAANGNPLMVQSALRVLVDRGQLRLTNGGWQFDSERSDEVVDRAIGEVLRQRIAALSPGTRQILTLAGIAGRSFTVDLLCDAAGASEDEVLDALAEAQRASVVAPSAGGSYAFDHARLGEVLKDDLVAEERAQLHHAIGLALERSGAPADLLAYHFARGTDERRAFTYLLAAGRAAFDARHFGVAARHLSAAVRGSTPSRAHKPCSIRRSYSNKPLTRRSPPATRARVRDTFVVS